MKTKKTIALLMLSIFILRDVTHSLLFFANNTVYAAEDVVRKIDIVAVLVDSTIYPNIKNDIERYATEYIQKNPKNRNKDTRAIVLDINTQTLQAHDIVKILENLYFDGIQNESSQLIGTVLIGDIPLPIIRDGNYIYPSIYPYVDFENQKFIWAEKGNFFGPNESGGGDAEIWHGLIKYDTIQDYQRFFDKLQTYHSNPNIFIGKNFWYEDFIANKKYVYKEGLNSYINNLIFSEDIGYHRYTKLFVNILQGIHNETIQDALSGFPEFSDVDLNQYQGDTPTLIMNKIINEGFLKSYDFLRSKKHLARIRENLEEANRWVTGKTELNGEMSFSPSRDAHFKQVALKDEILLRNGSDLNPLLIDFNIILEKSLNNKVEQEQYYMHIPMPKTYLEYEGKMKIGFLKKVTVRKKYEAYKNYLFGKDSNYLAKLEDANLYKGTFRNLDNLSGVTTNTIQNSPNPSTDLTNIDLNKKSVGASYDIFSQQVESNRGYSYLNGLEEYEIYNQYKIAKREHRGMHCEKRLFNIRNFICLRRYWKVADVDEKKCNHDNEEEQGGCEGLGEFSMRNRGGASSLNLDSIVEGTRKSGYNYKDARMNIIDIAGSRAVDEAVYEANSFESVAKCTNLIQEKFGGGNKYGFNNKSKLPPDIYGFGYKNNMGYDIKFTNWIPDITKDLKDPTWIKNEPKDYESINYFEKYDIADAEKTLEKNIIKIKHQTDDSNGGKGEIRTFGTIDSRMFNTSTTQLQLGGTTYQKFTDPYSPELIFSEHILDLIHELDIGNSGYLIQIQNRLEQMKNTIIYVNSGINTVGNFDIPSIDNYTNIGVITLANQRSTILTNNTYNQISEDVEALNEILESLEIFLENVDIDLIVNYINNMTYEYEINQKELEIYSNRIDDRDNAWNEIKHTLNNLDSSIVQSLYLSIEDVSNQDLTMTYTNLSSMFGCNNTPYDTLCDSLNDFIDNRTNYGPLIDTQINSLHNYSTQLVNIINVGEGAMNNAINIFNQKVSELKSSDNLASTGAINGMNITTPDRPIDSPRYMTFQGIGGNKVSFIYPNLYKVEVFNGSGNMLELKEINEIQIAIREYLSNTANQYNIYLQDQLDKKDIYYNDENIAFDKLAELDPLASPDTERSYQLLEEDFFIKKLEQSIRNSDFFEDQLGNYEPLEFVAYILYYQNINRQYKVSSDNIQDDISNTIASFDINPKVEHILDIYLQENNNKGGFISPKYKNNGYEVVYFNSDGSDYISSETKQAFISNLENKSTAFLNTIREGSFIIKEYGEYADTEAELIQECGIPVEGGVLLLDLTDMSSPWLKAFMCRLEKTMDKPFELSIGWPNLDNFGDQRNNTRENYGNQRQELDTVGYNENVLAQVNIEDYEKLHDLISYVQLRLEDSAIIADNPYTTLNIYTNKDFGNIDFKLYSVGDSCVKIEDYKICNTNGDEIIYSYNTELNPSINKDFSVSLDTVDIKVGYSVIVAEMCLPDIDECVKKAVKLSIIPGKAQKITLNSPSPKLLSNASVDIQIQAQDLYENNVSYLTDQFFRISTNAGSLGYGKNEWIDFNDFRENTFVYNAPDMNQQVATITLEEYDGEVMQLVDQENIEIVKGKLHLEFDTNTWDSNETGNIQINLADVQDYIYIDIYGNTQVEDTTLAKITFVLKDLNGEKIDITTRLNLQSKGGIVDIGTIETRELTVKDPDTQENIQIEQKRFANQNSILLENGEGEIYLLPNFKAGSGIITLHIQGIGYIYINIITNPGPAEVVKLSVENNNLQIGKDTHATVGVFDRRGNQIHTNPPLKIGALGPISLSSQSDDEFGNIGFKVQASEEPGIGYIFALIDGVDIDRQAADTQKIYVEKSLIPKDKLNAMYLNIFGNDWGNQRGYFSENQGFVENIMTNSNKLLASTTQLISPKKLKALEIIINPQGQIYLMGESGAKLKIVDGLIQIETTDNKHKIVAGENMQLNQMDTSSRGKNNNTLNTMYYIPNPTDSIIFSNGTNNNKLYINNETVLDMDSHFQHPNLNIELSKEQLDGYSLRDVYLEDRHMGQMYVLFTPNDAYIHPSSSYNTMPIRSSGSTNSEIGIAIYDIDSDGLDPSNKTYESIEDSEDPTLGIGFNNNFRNITHFGQNLSVGEATIPFGSEFLINLGDPTLRMVDENDILKTYDTKLNKTSDIGYDDGIGELIFAETEDTIMKVEPIDFNEDGLDDLLVVFTNGRIKLLKNYGGNSNYQDMQDIMRLAVGIKDVMIGDADGNGYQDIIIRTRNDELRVYKNNQGIFDVDGYPLCLNMNVEQGQISKNPQEMGDSFQIFFEDMDLDDNMDIIVNDELGFVKIFYGGGNSYISNEKYTCDDNRFQRQSGNTKVVTRFGIEIIQEAEITDDSLIRWKGLGIEGNEVLDITNSDVGIQEDNLDIGDINIESKDDLRKIHNAINEVSNFDIGTASNSYQNQHQRLIDDPLGITPHYESQGPFAYLTIADLQANDPIHVYKSYENLSGSKFLKNGDIVQVTVHIEAKNNFQGTFVDYIQGPWNIETRNDGSIKHFWFDESTISKEEIDNELGIIRNLQNSSYIIDNIQLKNNESLEFYYWLEYQNTTETPVVKIDIDDIDGTKYTGLTGANQYPDDNVPDIKTLPGDSCVKALNIFFNTQNQNNRDYDQVFIDLAKTLHDNSVDSENNINENTQDTLNNILSGAQNGDIDSILGSRTETLGWSLLNRPEFTMDNLLTQNGLDLSNLLNTPVQMLDAIAGHYLEGIEDKLDNLCNGFELGKGGCKGLPIPFNQAFLAPGNYHLFGCYDLEPLNKLLGDGRPVLNFPGNWPIPLPPGYIPAPGIFGFPFRGPGDGFIGGPQSGIFPSQFRLYLVPTLTMQLGVAMCFGPYQVGMNIPSPVSDIGGNCIVFALKGNCGSGNDGDESTGIDDGGIYDDLSDIGACNRPLDTTRPGGFQIVQLGEDINTVQKYIPNGSYAFGFTEIESNPVYTDSYQEAESGIYFDGVKIGGGANQANKITDGSAKGFMKKLVKDWMDRQLNYILNNFRRMQIDIFLPEFDDLFGGFDSLAENSVDYQKSKCGKIGGAWNKKTLKCVVSNEQTCMNKGKKRDATQEKCVVSSEDQNAKSLEKLINWTENNTITRKQIQDWGNFLNPFEELEKVFKDVNLVNIRTEDITVKIPMITSNDISAYSHMSKEWLQTNKKIVKDWDKFFLYVFNMCSDQQANSLADIQKMYQNLIVDLKEEKQTHISATETKEQIKNIIRKQKAILNLGNFDFSEVGAYTVFEACDEQTDKADFYVQVVDEDGYENIIPQSVYLAYKDDKLSMASQGYNLVDSKQKIKDSIQNGKVNYQKNKDTVSNIGICTKKSTNSKQNQCANIFLNGDFESALNTYFEFNTDAELLVSRVRQNLNTLELYKQFPIQLYERIHVQDRYMADILGMMQGFLGTISMWMKTNANRIAGYIDALTLIVTTLGTYQILMDFSNEWSERCGTCTNDNYDQYSCKLSFLCPDVGFPIIPIPPFKLPNIVVDLSEFNLGMDIKLPKFNFTPQALTLPSLPNLPSPPDLPEGDIDNILNIGGEINIPLVPEIPAPPNLPELPSLVPDIRLELPLIPPAPKIPKIPNEITATLKAAENLGKIMCIIKGGIGLVGEGSVKAKIEQLTQRTYDIPFRDEMDFTPKRVQDAKQFLESSKNVSTVDAPLMGFDFEIKSSVNIQYNFEAIYTLLASLADYANSLTDTLYNDTEGISDSISEFSTEFQRSIQKCIDNPFTEPCLKDIRLTKLTEDIRAITNKIDKLKKDMENSISKLHTLGIQKDQLVKQLAVYEKKISILHTTKQRYIEQLATETDEDKKNNLENIINKYTLQVNAYEEKKQETIQKITNIGREYELTLDEYDKLRKVAILLNDKVYNIKNRLRSLGKDLNSEVDNLLNGIKDSTDQLNKLINEGEDAITSFNKIQRQKLQSKKDKSISYLDIISNTKYVRYDTDVSSESYTNLKEGLLAIQDKTVKSDTKQIANDLLLLLERNKQATLDTPELDNVYQEANKVLDMYQEGQSKLAQNILDNYDSFVKKVDDNRIQLSNSDLEVKLFANLFTTKNIHTKNTMTNTIVSKEQKQIINPLSQNTPSIDTNVGDINKTQAPIDITSYINGIFVRSDDGKLINTVKSNHHPDRIQKSYIIRDVNQDGKDDLLMWDTHNIWVKYKTPKANNYISTQTDSYYYYKINNYKDLGESAKNGYVKIRKDWLKIYSKNFEVKNLFTKGQSYDDFRISRMNSEGLGDEIDGYLIKMNHRVDYFYDKGQIDINDTLINKKYIIALPEEAIYTGKKIRFEDYGNAMDIDKLLTGTILKVLNYRDDEIDLSAKISQAARARQYIEIYGLKYQKGIYSIYSPSSNQIIAGKQILGDDIGPEIRIELNRLSVNHLLEGYMQLEGYVSTHYDLKIQLEDNVMVEYAALIDQDGTILVEGNFDEPTAELLLEDLFFEEEVTKTYRVYTVDNYGNTNEQTIKFNILIPDIEIVDIIDISPYDDYADYDIVPVSIVAKLSNDIDEGVVHFNRRRNNSWQQLIGSNNNNSPDHTLQPLQKVIVSGLHEFSNLVGFFDVEDNEVGTLNPKNGEILINSAYQSQIDIQLDYSSGVPMIRIIDISNNTVLFSIHLPAEDLVNINEGSLEKVSLDSSVFGDFQGGRALKKGNQIYMYISTEGIISVVEELNGRYQFISSSKTVRYYFENSDTGVAEGYVEVKIRNFSDEVGM